MYLCYYFRDVVNKSNNNNTKLVLVEWCNALSNSFYPVNDVFNISILQLFVFCMIFWDIRRDVVIMIIRVSICRSIDDVVDTQINIHTNIKSSSNINSKYILKVNYWCRFGLEKNYSNKLNLFGVSIIDKFNF